MTLDPVVQARVLDRGRRLLRQGLDPVDVLLDERLALDALHGAEPDHLAPRTQRHADPGVLAPFAAPVLRNHLFVAGHHRRALTEDPLYRWSLARVHEPPGDLVVAHAFEAAQRADHER